MRRSAAAGAAGLVAVTAYLATTVVGGWLDPAYSQVADSISELTSSLAPNRAVLALGYLAYNVALVVLVSMLWRRSIPSRSTRAAFVLLLVTALAGLLMLAPFPQDSAGTPATTAGALHVAMASVASLALLAASFLLAHGWRSDPRWRGLAPVSLWVGVALLLTGPPGFVMAATASAYFGLFERCVAVVFLGWFLVIGVCALGPDRAAAETASSTPSPLDRSLT